MKVRASIKKICEDCKIVPRTKQNKKTLYVLCKKIRVINKDRVS